MKKILVLMLAAMMLLSFASCTSNKYEAAAKQLTELTGEKTTANDVKEAIEQMEELTGEKMTVEEFIEFTQGMYQLADGLGEYEPEDDEWPYKDIPEWPVAEGLEWNNYYGEDRIDLYVKGGIDEMNLWLAELKKEGFGGYFWEGDELKYYSEKYWIRLDDRGADEGEYHLIITEGDMKIGFPDEIKSLFPDYNGDGMLLYGGSEDYDGEIYYFFSALGETEEGGKRYLQKLKDLGFEDIYESYYNEPEGYYYKTVNGKTIGYASEEYWYMFDEETQTGSADFCLTVKPE